MALTDEDKKWLDSRFDLWQQRLDRKVAELEAGFDQKLEAVETRLLTEFHKWASPNEAKQRQFSTALRSFEVQLESLDDRVKKLEGR